MKPFTAAAVAILLANSATAAEPGTAAPFSPPVQEGVDHGFKDCAATVDKAIKRLREGDGGDGAPHYVDHWNPEGADGSLFNIVVIAAQGEGDVVSTVTAVRNASGSCDVMQTLVFPVPATCPEVRTDVFSHWTHAETASRSILLSDEGGGSVVLTPIPGGWCNVVKQVIFFQVR